MRDRLRTPRDILHATYQGCELRRQSSRKSIVRNLRPAATDCVPMLRLRHNVRRGPGCILSSGCELDEIALACDERRRCTRQFCERPLAENESDSNYALSPCPTRWLARRTG